jgi:hypothetical protein
MTHIPGHTDSAPVLGDALATLDSTLETGGAGAVGAYVNQVYLRPIEVPGAKGNIRGKKIDTGKAYADQTISISEAKRMYLTDAELRKSWENKLRSLGQSINEIQARALWDISVAGASDWYSTSNGQQKITPQQYLEWYVGGKKGAGNLPSRQIYAPTADMIDADINAVATKALGRELQAEDRTAEWYQDLVKGINKLYNKGTVTTVEQVKNPKTGKLETVTKQTPKFSKEQIENITEEKLVAADPESAERKKRLDGIKWLYSMGGQQR